MILSTSRLMAILFTSAWLLPWTLQAETWRGRFSTEDGQFATFVAVLNEDRTAVSTGHIDMPTDLCWFDDASVDQVGKYHKICGISDTHGLDCCLLWGDGVWLMTMGSEMWSWTESQFFRDPR